MKGFERKNQFLSLCGLNCHLCPMYLGKYCGGCGVDNQSCKIASCSLEHGKIEFCYECKNYPCDRYLQSDESDSFITYQNRKSDLEKAKNFGIERYSEEQAEKEQILHMLLSEYNDGRRKNFYCIAVNLLNLSDLQEMIFAFKNEKSFSLLKQKEQCTYIVNSIASLAEQKGISLKLRKGLKNKQDKKF